MDSPVPNVWIVYDDRRKDLEPAAKYGKLCEMFTGHIDYRIAVRQARKMFGGRYKQHDYILIVGDPKLVAIVVTVAEKYYSEDGKINMLCWNKRKLEYYPESFEFPDEEEDYEEPEAPAEVIYKAQRG
jgi:hypothetical protein